MKPYFLSVFINNTKKSLCIPRETSMPGLETCQTQLYCIYSHMSFSKTAHGPHCLYIQYTHRHTVYRAECTKHLCENNSNVSNQSSTLQYNACQWYNVWINWLFCIINLVCLQIAFCNWCDTPPPLTHTHTQTLNVASVHSREAEIISSLEFVLKNEDDRLIIKIDVMRPISLSIHGLINQLMVSPLF